MSHCETITRSSSQDCSWLLKSSKHNVILQLLVALTAVVCICGLPIHFLQSNLLKNVFLGWLIHSVTTCVVGGCMRNRSYTTLSRNQQCKTRDFHHKVAL